MRAPIKTLPSYGLLHKLLEYNPETGSLVWKVQEGSGPSIRGFNCKCGGKSAGSLTTGRVNGGNRYLVVGIRENGIYRQYQAHRIIWKMVTGEDPPSFIDHRDGNQLNNKWSNFRLATNGQNIQNSVLRKDNKSGVKGVCWDAAHKKWRAQISLDKRQFKIGRFASIDEAKVAIEQARAKLHSEFARYL